MNDIRTRATMMVAAAAFATATLAGCAATTTTGALTAGPAASASSPAAVSPATLATASTSLGTIVVDGTGMTVYVFDKDRKGGTTSACTGGCARTWPAVETDAASPAVTGVTGTVGTMPGANGKRQVTLDGFSLYTFASDTAAGDAKGQGVDGIWWVVGADGAKIAITRATSSSPSPSSGGHKAGY